MDGLDQLCKNLHDGYQCAAIDAELEDGEVCDPWFVTYQVPNGWIINLWKMVFLGEDQDFSACGSMNSESKCAQYACHVEAHFLVQEWLYLKAGNPANFEFFHENESDVFSQVNNCFGSSRMVKVFEPDMNFKDCCGGYPVRTPFVIGDKECCGNSVYNVVSQECCWDDSVKGVGHCEV